VETSASFEARSAPLPHPANRKQNQAKPDCGGAAKAQPNIHREITVTAPVLDSTPDYNSKLLPAGGLVDCHDIRLERLQADEQALGRLATDLSG
jgi:hypothetical protein